MTNVENEISLSRLELVVLARLSSAKPPSEKDLGDAVLAFALPAESPARARQVAAEVLAGLRHRALVSDAKRAPTDEGRRALAAAFELERTPTWLEVRDRHLPALALGLAPGSDEVARVLRDGETVAAAVLRAELKVASAATVNALGDALIAEALGMPPGPITLQRIRAHVLAERAGVAAKGEPAQIAGRVAAATLRTRRSDKRSLVQALARRWVSADAEGRDAAPVQLAPPESPAPSVPPQPASAVSSQPASPPPSWPRDASAPLALVQPLSADALLTMVREAIPMIGADGRFGPEKVFISAIWHRIEGAGAEFELSLERFKKWLVIANRDRLLDLARADLVGAMDPQQVAESEIEDLGATFHFVLDRRAVALGPERRSHAR